MLHDTLLDVKEILPHATRPGCATLRRPDGSTVHSIQPDGTIGSQPANFDGGYETCQITGTIATFAPEGPTGRLHSYPIALMDKLA